MKNNAYRLCFALILGVGILLRFAFLGNIPNGLYQDETAIGYNALSILKTGRDEHGQRFPTYFKSFGDYKLPVYIYLTVPSVAAFGVTPFAVRLPSAVFGVLSLIVFYALILKLSKNPKLSLFSMGLLAINPWHLHYSRATFEVSIGLFFFILGAYCLHEAFARSKRGLFFAGTLAFVVAIYTYNLTRLLSPILFVTSVFFFRRQYPNKPIPKKELILSAIVAAVFLVPFVFSLFGNGGVSSAGGTLITTSAVSQAPRVEFQSYMTVLPVFVRKMLFNSLTLTLWQYITHIAGYVSVPFFFITGSPHGNHGIGTSGQFYLFELPLLFIALSRIRKTLGWMLYMGAWSTLVIAVAALTREVPHATRSFFLVAPITAFSAFGLYTIIEYILRTKKNIWLYLGIVLSTLFVSFNILYYFASYYIRFPVFYAGNWRSADGEVARFIGKNEPNYEKIIIDSSSGFIYSSLLFYNRIDPTLVQEKTIWSPDDSEGFSFPTLMGKYEFREIHWEEDLKRSNTLIITTASRKPDNAPPLVAFYYPRRPVVFALKQTLERYPVEEIAYVAVSTKKK